MDGRGVIAVLIILVMVGVACFATSTLGDPRAPASDVRPLSIPIPEFRVGLDGSAAEATAISARATADALRAREITATQRAVQSTAGAEQAMTQEAHRISQESTAIIQGTERAHLYMLQGWTATADAVLATTQAEVQATASSVAYTQTARADDLIYQYQASIATATQIALWNEQREREMELRSKELTNEAWAIAKWAVPVLLFGVVPLILIVIGAVIFYRRMEYRVIMPAPNGDKPIVLHKGRAIDPDLLPQAVTDLANPPALPLDKQLEVKANDQRIDTARALPRVVNATAIQTGPAFTVLPAGAAPPAHLLPDPDVTGIIDGEWDAAK